MFNSYNPYTPYNTYYMQPNYMQAQRPQNVEPNYQQFNQQSNMQNENQSNFRQAFLQGKTVDSIDVVKAMDIPLDGSISYFPIVDGSAIVTKQLQKDGTSKTLIYKPVDNKEEVKQPIYITPEQLEEKMKGFNSKEIKDIKEEIKSLKREIRDITDEIKDKRED